MRRTTLCYLTCGGQTLMLHRTKKKGDPNKGKWVGIGGGFEPGETPEMCMLREFEEETGLIPAEYRARGVIHFCSDTWEDEEMHLFSATAFRGAQKVCDEGDLAWIANSEILSLNLWAGDSIFLGLLAQDAPWFELTLQYAGDDLVRAELNGEEYPIHQEDA